MSRPAGGLSERRTEAHALQVLPGRLAVTRLDPGSAMPDWATRGHFWCVTRSENELSVVCDEGAVPSGRRSEGPFRALRVQGPLDFSLVGVLARLASTLAAAGVPIFVISTYETDYLLVKEEKLPAAMLALSEAGHTVAE